MLTNPQLQIRKDMYTYHNKIKQRIKTMSSLSTNTLTGTKTFFKSLTYDKTGVTVKNKQVLEMCLSILYIYVTTVSFTVY